MIAANSSIAARRVRHRRARRCTGTRRARADDRRGGECRRPQRHDVREVGLIGDQRSDRSPGRRDHRVDGAEHERDHEQRPERSGLDLAVDDERDGARHPAEQEQRGDPPPVETVGHPSADEEEQHGGDELGESDPSDVEFVAGDVERLLEQDRDEDVQADGGERGRPQVTANGRVPQDVASTGHGGTLPIGTPHPGRGSAPVQADSGGGVGAGLVGRLVGRLDVLVGRRRDRLESIVSVDGVVRIVGGDLVRHRQREHRADRQHHQATEAVDRVTRGPRRSREPPGRRTANADRSSGANVSPRGTA